MENDVLETILDTAKVNGMNGVNGVNGHHAESLDLRELLKVLSLVKNGKLNVRMPVTQAGINGRICEVLNDIIEMNERLVAEISSAEMTIGKRGNLAKRIELPD